MNRLILITFCFLFLNNTSLSQDIPSTVAVIDSIMNNLVAENSPGYAVMVIKDGKIILQKGYGLADLSSNSKINSATPFYLASLSKAFTAMAFGILYEKELIDWEDYMIKYLPGFPDYGRQIKIKHLLAHTSGLPDHYDFVGEDVRELSNKDVWNLLLMQDSLLFQPGKKFAYSNSAYVLLAVIVEKISGKSMSEFLQDNIFVPLKMKSSIVYDNRRPAINGKSVGYTADSTGKFYENDYSLVTTGAGGIYSTLEDLYNWDQALNSEQLVKKTSIEKMTTPFVLNSGENSNYGFGWMIGNYENGKLNGERKIYHTGSLKGFRNLFVRIPGKNLSFIALSNSGKHLAEAEEILKLFVE